MSGIKYGIHSVTKLKPNRMADQDHKEREETKDPNHLCDEFNTTDMAYIAAVTANEAYHWHNPIDKRAPKLCSTKQVADCSIWLVAESLMRSHLYTCIKEAWRHNLDLILWIDFDYEMLEKHPELTKVNKASLMGAETRQRGFRYWELGGYKFALSPAMNSFRLFRGQLWEGLGLGYRERILPFLDEQRPVRYLEVEYKKTLLQPYRNRILFAVDRDYKPGFDMDNPETDGTKVAQMYDIQTAIRLFPKVWKEEAERLKTHGMGPFLVDTPITMKGKGTLVFPTESGRGHVPVTISEKDEPLVHSPMESDNESATDGGTGK